MLAKLKTSLEVKPASGISVRMVLVPTPCVTWDVSTLPCDTDDYISVYQFFTEIRKEGSLIKLKHIPKGFF
jgi:hypothetical protein